MVQIVTIFQEFQSDLQFLTGEKQNKKVVLRSLKVSLNQNLKVEDLESAQFSIYIQM